MSAQVLPFARNAVSAAEAWEAYDIAMIELADMHREHRGTTHERMQLALRVADLWRAFVRATDRGQA